MDCCASTQTNQGATLELRHFEEAAGAWFKRGIFVDNPRGKETGGPINAEADFAEYQRTGKVPGYVEVEILAGPHQRSQKTRAVRKR